jgi:thiosulfate dehydrogenase
LARARSARPLGDARLRTGSNRFGTVAGNGRVVQHSTQYLSNEDLLAVGTYLACRRRPRNDHPRRLPQLSPAPSAELYSTRGGLALSAVLRHLSSQRRQRGARLVPALAGNPTLQSDDLLADPHHAHRMACGTPCQPKAMSMPAFSALSDGEIAGDPQLRTGQLGWTSTGQYQRTKSPGCVRTGDAAARPRPRFEAPRLADMLKEILLSSSVAPVSISRPAACCPSTWATD